MSAEFASLSDLIGYPAAFLTTVAFVPQAWHSWRTRDLWETLNKSSMSRVVGKIAMIARSATKVVAGTTMPRSATKRARDIAATRTGTGFAGGLRRCARCEGDQPFAASRALRPIPQSRVRGHAGLVQCFPGISLPMYALFTAGVALWLVYGIVLGSLPIILANTVTLLLAALVLLLKLAERRS